MKRQDLAGRQRVPLLALALALALSGCGGGGGSPGVGGTGGSGGTGGTGGSGGSGSGGTTVTQPAVTLALVDGSGSAVSTLSGGQSATVKATVKTAAGAPAANAIVQFSASASGLVQFTPASGSALTDANGVAVVTVKPASFDAAGAVAITASAAVAGQAVTASANIAVGAAPLTVGTLSFAPVPSASLPAFSTLSLNIPITSGGQPVSSVSGLSMTSLCVGDGTATLVPGTLANGVQVATYTNNGCLRGHDVITVAVGNSVQTIGVDVSSANIGAIQFANTSQSGISIVLKGSGGQGRSEAAQVTFRVVDQHNNGLPGVDVNFSPTTSTGGLTVTPSRATTDASGNVSTMVSSGTIPTPVRVIAEATRNGVTISGLSDTLTVSTGLPIQRSMSLSSDKYNIEGLNYDGAVANLTVRLADQYGNPVSDNTAVNFVTEGGAVGSSAQGACLTSNGGCTVKLTSQEFRPANGRVTVLAYLQGIEDFIDENGDGQYSCTNYKDVNGAVPANYRPLVDICESGGEKQPDGADMGDPFLDTGNPAVLAGNPQVLTLDGVYEPAKNDLPIPYNKTSYSKDGNGKWGLNYIRRSIEIVFSGSQATLIRQVCSSDGLTCRDWDTNLDGANQYKVAGLSGPGCAVTGVRFRLIDKNNNPLPADTSVSPSADGGLTVLAVAPDRIPSTNLVGGTIHGLTIKPATGCTDGSVTLKVTTPNGNLTPFTFTTN